MTRFVRDQDHLAVYREGATGRVLSHREAQETFGKDILQEALDYGAANLPVSREEPAASLRGQRERLGLSIDAVAKRARLNPAAVRDAEDPSTRSPIRDLESIAEVLGLDERLLTLCAGSGADPALAVRLKTLGEPTRGFSSGVVLTLSQAAWVIRTQARLQRFFGKGRRDQLRDLFQPDPYYGDPPWRYGYELADRARRRLSDSDLIDLDDHGAIPNMRELLVELGISLIQAELPESIAGVTLETGPARGMVINVRGFNENVWVRRATMAHELGHLLWDPPRELQNLRVDTYDEMNRVGDSLDPVEARANAFAIDFLAPHEKVRQVYEQSRDEEADGVRRVMEAFGISKTAAQYHIWNALHRTRALEDLESPESEPSPEWQGREDYTGAYFPIKSTSLLRRGEFAGWVVAAEKAGFISEDTAAGYLETDVNEYTRSRDMIAELYPAICQ